MNIYTNEYTLPCGCRIWIDAAGELTGAVVACRGAQADHVDRQLAAIKREVKREVVATLEGLASDDPETFEAARTSEMGQMVRKAARKRGGR